MGLAFRLVNFFCKLTSLSAMARAESIVWVVHIRKIAKSPAVDLLKLNIDPKRYQKRFFKKIREHPR